MSLYSHSRWRVARPHPRSRHAPAGSTIHSRLFVWFLASLTTHQSVPTRLLASILILWVLAVSERGGQCMGEDLGRKMTIEVYAPQNPNHHHHAGGVLSGNGNPGTKRFHFWSHLSIASRQGCSRSAQSSGDLAVASRATSSAKRLRVTSLDRSSSMSFTYYGFQTVCKCPFRALLVTRATDSNQTWAN